MPRLTRVRGRRPAARTPVPPGLGRTLLAAALAVPCGVQAAPAPACHVSGAYTVVTRERARDPGTDILVVKGRPRPGPCRYAPTAADFVVGKGEPFYFLAFAAPVLALDAGTGAARSLVLFDVSRRAKLLDAPYDDARKVVPGDGVLTFWRIRDGAVKPDACPAAWRSAPDHAGLKAAHVVEETRFAFADRVARATGATDCTATEDDVNAE